VAEWCGEQPWTSESIRNGIKIRHLLESLGGAAPRRLSEEGTRFPKPPNLTRQLGQRFAEGLSKTTTRLR